MQIAGPKKLTYREILAQQQAINIDFETSGKYNTAKSDPREDKNVISLIESYKLSLDACHANYDRTNAFNVAINIGQIPKTANADKPLASFMKHLPLSEQHFYLSFMSYTQSVFNFQDSKGILKDIEGKNRLVLDTITMITMPTVQDNFNKENITRRTRMEKIMRLILSEKEAGILHPKSSVTAQTFAATPQ